MEMATVIPSNIPSVLKLSDWKEGMKWAHITSLKADSNRIG